MAYSFNIETLYEKTDNGLEIFKLYLSGCKGFDKALQNQKEPFQFRDNDDTLSAYLISPDKKLKSATVNYWRFKDYGDEFFTPIKIAMQFTGLDFFPCLKYLYEHFNLVEGKTFFKAETEVKTIEPNDKTNKLKTGDWTLQAAKEHYDLKVIGRFVTPELAAEYHFKTIESYTKVFIKKGTDNLTHIVVKSTDSFPIFAYNPSKDWCKTYAPLSNDKNYKHGYLGKKPERFIHGLERLKNAFAAKMRDFDNDIKIAKALQNTIRVSELLEEKAKFKFDRAIICSGGSDGLNVASLGEFALWFNSESEQINFAEFTEIKKYVHVVFNLADVDTQGIKYAHEVAEAHWTLKTIWLPKDKLGFCGKDFRDWMKYYQSATLDAVKHHFSNLIMGALQMKFFEISKRGGSVKIKPSYLHYFLKVKGFHLYYPEKQFTDKVAEQEYIFIQVKDNIVTQVFPNQIRKFCERYLIAKGQNIDVIDAVKNSVQFSDKNLLGLDDIVLDFRNYTMNSQTFFFNNLFAKVTAEKIDLEPYKNYKNSVWSDSKLSHDIMPESPFFKHTIDEEGNDRVKILRDDCEFMNFLINTSRIFWRKELEEPFTEAQQKEKLQYHSENRFNLFGEILTPEEKHLQEKHFLNKCFSLGYLLHKQKRSSFSKAIYAIDDKQKDSEDDANGRSGKSLTFVAVDQLASKRFLIDGKNRNITTDKHLLHGLTKENDYLYIEDLDQYTSFEFFYNWITGSLNVNPKNTKPYEVKFMDSPKIVFTSNYGLPRCSPSTLGRILFMSFSDYYHVKTDHYQEERKVNSDFGGIDLFSNAWTSKQWNVFYNFLLQCVQLYLRNFNHEINAPQNNIDVTNAKASMGDVFIEWCESYFTNTETITVDDGAEVITGTLNEFVPRSVMQENYAKRAGKFSKTAANFKKSLQQYCKINGYVLNPIDLCDKDGYIKKPIIDSNGKRQNVEHFYIRTPDAIVYNQDEIAQIDNSQLPSKNNPDDLPF